MRPLALERGEEIRIDAEPAGRIGVDLRDPSLHPFGIELRVPCAIERIAHVNAAAVAAELDHLRRAVEWSRFRMLRVRDDPAEANFPGRFRMERIAHVILMQV